MIPKTIHQIWLGNKPIPEEEIQYQEAWVRLHPDWQFRLWTEKELGVLQFQNEVLQSVHKNLLKDACHFGQQANIYRLELLRKYGGLYVDTDTEPLKNIEPMIKDREAFVGQQFFHPNCCSNALIGAVPNHPWIDKAVRLLPTKDPKISLSMGDVFITHVSILHLKEVYRIPVWQYLSAYSEKLTVKIRPTSNTFVVHHFCSRWNND